MNLNGIFGYVYIYFGNMIDESAHAISRISNWGISINTIWKVEADQSYNVHRIDHGRNGLIAIRTLAGKGQLRCNKRVPIDLEPDSFIIVPYADILRYHCTNESWRFWWFEIEALHLQEVPEYQYMKAPSYPEETEDYNTCMQLIRSGQSSFHRRANAILENNMHRYIHDWTIKAGTIGPHQKAVAVAIEMMHTNLGSLDIAALAKKACLSDRRFRQVFRSIAGMPPKQYYDLLRLKNAAARLTTTTQSIANIAEELGYSSQFHFSRAFKNEFGVSPAKYRR